MTTKIALAQKLLLRFFPAGKNARPSNSEFSLRDVALNLVPLEVYNIVSLNFSLMEWP